MSDFSLSDFSRALADVVARAAPVTASIAGTRRRSVSAFHWRDGLYIAAEEAVEAEDEAEMTLHGGEPAKAEIVGRDPSTGIALLRPAVSPALPALAASADVMVGTLAVVAGFNGSSPLAAFGLVNEAGPEWRSMRGGTIDRRIGLSAALDGRFEGAAALDPDGALIGLVLFGPRRRPLVIPAATIDRVAPLLRDKGHVARGYLGAGLHPVHHPTLSGAMVMSLDEDGPARSAGLHLGDIVTAWDGDPVQGPRDLIRRLGPDSVGRAVSLTILRGGAEREVSVAIGSRPLT